MMYPPCGPEEDSLAPYTEIEVDPLVEITLTMTLMTRRFMMATLMMSLRTPKG